MSAEAPLDKIPIKKAGSIRLVTFNINGYRTVFHYHPWNKLRNFANMYESLHGDIITLQELKVAAKDVDNSIGRLKGYNSFLTVPSLKKGYSGVGVYVRCPKDDEPEFVKRALKVIKAEEGLTGVLVSHDTKKRYVQSDNCIGGYPNLEEDVCRHIDSEGRSVVIEMANNTVIISVYCPANSMGTEQGEQFRIQFLEALFQRIRNLEQMGKHVILMGDINVSRDLIDSADGINDRLKNGKLLKVQDKFEELNRSQCLNFIHRSIPRLLLNEILLDSIDQDTQTERPRIMVDLVRKIQGRKQALYTVWNTLKNSRPGNYGSRIDLILATETISKLCHGSNIWPFLMGSDHCPVYADLDVSTLNEGEPFSDKSLPKLEARYVYKLSAGSIDTMFANLSKRKASPQAEAPISTSVKKIKVDSYQKPKYKKPVKGQNQISNFFSRVPSNTENEVVILEEDQNSPKDNLSQASTKSSSSLKLDSKGQFSLTSSQVPRCKHDEPCILKTAMTKENKGKKFWTCEKPVGHSDTPEGQEAFTCGYFQWK